jgi:hypothetical protein
MIMKSNIILTQLVSLNNYGQSCHYYDITTTN